MPRTGRPSKLTPQRHETLVNALRIGNYLDTAATLANVDRSTVYIWLAKGREAKSGEYHDFFVAVKQAEAAAEDAAVRIVMRAGALDPKNWAAAMTFLERRHRSKWARPPQTMAEHGAPEALPDPAAVTDDLVVVPTADRLAGILEALDRAGKMPVTDDTLTNGAGPADGHGGEPLPGGGRRPSAG